jgi:CheY-like chemotaxis protein
MVRRLAAGIPPTGGVAAPRVAFDQKLVALDIHRRSVAGRQCTVVEGLATGQKLEGIHVLLVDDDESARHLPQRALAQCGALVSVASGPSALRAALRADVIVVDLATAEAVGGEFLFQLQRLHSRPNRPVPIIGLAPLGLAIRATLRAAGLQRYLLKPVNADELRAAVLELTRE